MSGCGPRIVVALVIAGFAMFKYFQTSREANPFTGRMQRVELNPQQEISMGLHSAPQMERQYGGASPDAQAREYVSRVGRRIVASTDAGRTKYRFDFHLLNDHDVVNAFALPGGQVFITEALFRMLSTEDELAGVLGHEIGHVVGRHSSEQIAKSDLLNGLTSAFSVGVSGSNGGYDAARMAQFVNQLVNLKFTRGDESEADKLGVRFMMEAGYQPEAMIKVMEILKRVAGSGKQPEIMSTHPDPENRIGKIKEEIARLRSQNGGK
jgi:predicted Zn-dependent protease